MHLSVPTVHLPAVHLPVLRVPAAVSAATVLLSAVYVAAIAVALTAPGEHALAGCVVLAGLVGRTVVRRRRSAVAAVPAVTDAVDAVLPEEVILPAPATPA